MLHAKKRVALGYCVMPNHWHLVVWPERDGDLSEIMRWLTLTHTQRWHAKHHTQGTGPLYQGRFKAFPVAKDEHCLCVLRYAERNPRRAGAKCASMALEQPGPSDAWIARPAVGDGPGREIRALARVAGSTGNRGRVDRIASERGPRHAVRRGVVAATDGQTSGPGVESAARGASVESRKNPAKTM